MRLTINGEIHELENVTTVQELLEHFQLQNKLVIVEHNRTILEKGQHAQVKLADGDQLEIVHFVGGG
ncbi:sulfur carrier protein ThiS [Bacillaceae bacterium]